MFFKGLFISDIDYQFGILVSEVRKFGLLEQGISFMLREMVYFFLKGVDWYQFYDYIKFFFGKKVVQFGIIVNVKVLLKILKIVIVYDSFQVGRF